MDFTAIVPTTYNPNSFSSLTTESESVFEVQKKVELLDLFVTEYPRLSEEDLMPTQFAFTYFADDARNDMMKNQDKVHLVNAELFSHTVPLDEFQQNVLNKSYQKAVKSAPTRANRL